MRHVLNISLPKEMANIITREVAKRHYSSTSEFIRKLVIDWHREQEEKKLLRQLERSRKQILAGNFITEAEFKEKFFPRPAAKIRRKK